MRIKALSFAASLLLVSNSSAGIPQTATTTASAPQLDPQALSVLAQMTSATGWSNASLPQDATATGAITSYSSSSPITVNAVYKSKGPRLFRADVQQSTGTVTTVLNGDSAGTLAPSGQQALPGHVALGMRPFVFPFFCGLLSSTSTVAQYQGIETVDGQSGYRISVSSLPSGTDPMSVMRAQASHVTVWVAVPTGLPIQMEYARPSLDNSTASRLIRRKFSNYRIVNGLAVPFHQEEFANNQLLSALDLSSVAFNVGLSDADFTVPIPQDGGN